jgi:hypothetical protein
MARTTQSGIRQRVTDDAADTDQPAAGAGCTPRTRGGAPVKALCWEGLDEGPQGYDLFKNKKDGCVRAVFQP